MLLVAIVNMLLLVAGFVNGLRKSQDQGVSSAHDATPAQD